MKIRRVLSLADVVSLAVGLACLCAQSLSAATLYVDLNTTNSIPPFDDWTNAAVTIQDAVDAANAGDTILVTNGVYTSGGRTVNGYALTNRVAVTKPLTLQSVNGPAVTIIQGYQMPDTINGDNALRCVYLTNGAAMIGFTLINGATRVLGDSSAEQCGGGVWSESSTALVTNCTFTGNSAHNLGGGAYSGTLNNCKFSGNTAYFAGGGAADATLSNCTLTSNSVSFPLGYTTFSGGGAFWCTLNNCTLTGNSALNGGGASASTLNNCMLTGNLAKYGGGAAAYIGGMVYPCTLNNCVLTGNSALNGGGAWDTTLNNCTLAGNSATNNSGGAGLSWLNNCIVYFNTAPIGANYGSSSRSLNYCCTTPLPASGAGNFTNEPVFVDLAGGNFRLQTNSPCINTGDNTSVVGSMDLDGRPRIVGGTVDIGAYEFQGPGMGEFIGWLQQYVLPTDGSADHADADSDGMSNWKEWLAGTDPTNALSVLRMLSPTGDVSGVVVSWQSVTNRTYSVQRATDHGAQPAFSTLATNLAGLVGTTSYTDTNAIGDGPYFYRVGVQP